MLRDRPQLVLGPSEPLGLLHGQNLILQNFTQEVLGFKD